MSRGIHVRLVSGLCAGGMLFALSAPARAGDVVTGEVVDLACYLPHPETSRGPSHRKCADVCAKKGIPIGVVTDDGQLYLLLEDHENPKAYAQLKEKAAERVTVEGEKVTRGGVQGLVAETLK